MPPAMTRFPPLAVEGRGLACARGGRSVFADASFQVRSGAALAVTGPNGSGKSSLLRIIAGLLRAQAGTLTFEGAGETPFIHYLGHADALKPALSLAETLRFWAALYGNAERPVDAAEDVGLAHALGLPVGVLSAGQRRRAGLARLLVSPRPLWLLDEPFAALDAEGEALLARLMVGHLEAGGLIVAATHQTLPLSPVAVMSLAA
jgi:heme exporter protein A